MAVLDLLFGLLLLPVTFALGDADYQTRSSAHKMLSDFGRMGYVAERLGLELAYNQEMAERCEALIENQSGWNGLTGEAELSKCRWAAKLALSCPLWDCDEAAAYFSTPKRILVLLAEANKLPKSEEDEKEWLEEVMYIVNAGLTRRLAEKLVSDTIGIGRYGWLPNVYPLWWMMR